MSRPRSQAHRRFLRRLRALLVAVLATLVALGAAAPLHAAAAACSCGEQSRPSSLTEWPDDDEDSDACPPTCDSCPCERLPFVPNALDARPVAQPALAELLPRNDGDGATVSTHRRGLERPPRP